MAEQERDVLLNTSGTVAELSENGTPAEKLQRGMEKIVCQEFGGAHQYLKKKLPTAQAKQDPNVSIMRCCVGAGTRCDNDGDEITSLSLWEFSTKQKIVILPSTFGPTSKLNAKQCRACVSLLISFSQTQNLYLVAAVQHGYGTGSVGCMNCLW